MDHWGLWQLEGDWAETPRLTSLTFAEMQVLEVSVAGSLQFWDHPRRLKAMSPQGQTLVPHAALENQEGGLRRVASVFFSGWKAFVCFMGAALTKYPPTTQ